MPRYTAETQEEAYELMMVQGLTFNTVLGKLREKYPKLSANTLTKWRREGDWEGRFKAYQVKLAERSDVERVKQVKPILFTIQDLREKTYDQVVKFLSIVDKDGIEENQITVQNLPRVLDAFVKLSEMENKLTGGALGMHTAKELVNILIMVIERDPVVGPVFKANKSRIADAVFEEMEKGRR